MQVVAIWIAPAVMVVLSFWLGIRDKRKAKLEREKQRCDQIRDAKLESCVDMIVHYMANGARDFYEEAYKKRMDEETYKHG